MENKLCLLQNFVFDGFIDVAFCYGTIFVIFLLAFGEVADS